MSSIPPAAPAGTSRPIVERIRGLLFKPQAEWAHIADEPATVGSLYRYVAIVAALPAIALAIRFAALGSRMAYVGVGANWAIRLALYRYVTALVAVYLIGLVIDALAPQFGAGKNQIQAMKVSAYAPTAAWVGGIFVLIPWFGWLIGIAGAVYSIYLLYLGLPIVMRTSADKAVGYTIVTILAAIVIFVCLGVVSRLLGGGGMYAV